MNSYRTIKLIVGMLLVLLVSMLVTSCKSSSILGYNDEDRSRLNSEIRNLHQQTLIVRLYTNNNKIKVLRRRGAVDKLNEFQADRKAYADLMVEGWSKYYDFSKVLFMPDSLYNDFVADPSAHVFINQNLELDPSIQLETEDYYILARGDRDLAFVWLRSNGSRISPQPPMKNDKLTMLEVVRDRNEYFFNRIDQINKYFHKINRTPKPSS